tara:strand:+ start:66 stop:860 length:795 start_codon:yes stop_codon:yes gene_type:complete
MSSIYRKGRDGYYYYQTYVYNPENKKKDKRVFHALGTKDVETAKLKQNELDLKYDKQSLTDFDSIDKFHIFNLKTSALIILIITITVYLGNLIKKKEVVEKTNFSIDSKNNQEIYKNNDSAFQIVDTQDTFKEQVKYTKEIPVEEKNSTEAVNIEKIIPTHTVERVERLSGAFEQGKLYVSIDIKSSNASQNLLCRELKKRYNEFSNIIICLYANNHAGRNLALGNDNNVNIEEQKRFWLAMYTYNSVEGEYFDDNPSGYLGPF